MRTWTTVFLMPQDNPRMWTINICERAAEEVKSPVPPLMRRCQVNRLTSLCLGSPLLKGNEFNSLHYLHDMERILA